MDPVVLDCVHRLAKGREPSLLNICNSFNRVNFNNAIILGDLNFPDINPIAHRVQ